MYPESSQAQFVVKEGRRSLREKCTTVFGRYRENICRKKGLLPFSKARGVSVVGCREHRFNMFVPDGREDTRALGTERSPLLGSINLFSTMYYVFPSRDQVDFFFTADEETCDCYDRASKSTKNRRRGGSIFTSEQFSRGKTSRIHQSNSQRESNRVRVTLVKLIKQLESQLGNILQKSARRHVLIK